MGGVADTIGRVAAGVSTFGLSEAGRIPGSGKIGATIGSTSKALSTVGSTPGLVSEGVSSAARSGAGVQTMVNAPRDAAGIAARTLEEQNRLAAKAEQTLKLQPKKVASDDFLANKNKMLQNMRLGLLSSVGGSAGAAAPSLSAPSLTGKSKLGA